MNEGRGAGRTGASAPNEKRKPCTAAQKKPHQLKKDKPGKEVNAMNYEKPQIVALQSACDAIQKLTKAMSTNDSVHEPSVTAYEADE